MAIRQVFEHGALTSERSYLALAAFNAGDAVACAIPLPFIAKILGDLSVPPEVRWVLPVAKAAATIGLLSAASFLVTYAVMTAKGPGERSG